LNASACVTNNRVMVTIANTAARVRIAIHATGAQSMARRRNLPADDPLVEVLAKQNVEYRQPIHAVYYRNTAISARIASFVSYLAEAIGEDGFSG